LNRYLKNYTPNNLSCYFIIPKFDITLPTLIYGGTSPRILEAVGIDSTKFLAVYKDQQLIDRPCFNLPRREIAELTGKEHKNVMADIRKMLEELGKRSADFLADVPDSYIIVAQLCPEFTVWTALLKKKIRWSTIGHQRNT